MAFVLISASALASVSLDKVPTVPRNQAGILTGKISSDLTGTLRLNFRRKGFGDFYYVAMHASNDGKYFWGVLPKPEAATDSVEVYISVLDAAGKEIAKSDVSVIPVGDGKVELSSDQAAAAGHMSIGNTTLAQNGHGVAWFSGDGVASRTGATGGSSFAGGSFGGAFIGGGSGSSAAGSFSGGGTSGGSAVGGGTSHFGASPGYGGGYGSGSGSGYDRSKGNSQGFPFLSNTIIIGDPNPIEFKEVSLPRP